MSSFEEMIEDIKRAIEESERTEAQKPRVSNGLNEQGTQTPGK